MEATKQHYKVSAARNQAKAALAAAGFKKFCVVMENFNGECKRVARHAFSPEMAMADAQMAYSGWIPVGVE